MSAAKGYVVTLFNQIDVNVGPLGLPKNDG